MIRDNDKAVQQIKTNKNCTKLWLDLVMGPSIKDTRT